MTAANEPAATPLSVEEMRALIRAIERGWPTFPAEYERAIATAAALERAKNWILVHERDAGVGVIPALKTVGEALAEEAKLNENLFRSVDEFNLSVRSQNCLLQADIRTIGDLIQKTEAELLKMNNFGKKSLKEIKNMLRKMGLALGSKARSAKKKAMDVLSAADRFVTARLAIETDAVVELSGPKSLSKCERELVNAVLAQRKS